MHACRRAGIKQGSSCIIIGAGAVGLLCAVAARLEGCKRVAIADIVETRVKFATEKGFADAGFVAPATRYSDPQEQLRAARSIASSLGGIKYDDGAEVGRSDFVFECTGVEICVQSSIYVSGYLLRFWCNLLILARQPRPAARPFSWAWARRIISCHCQMQEHVRSISSQSGGMQIAIPEPLRSCSAAKRAALCQRSARSSRIDSMGSEVFLRRCSGLVRARMKWVGS